MSRKLPDEKKRISCKRCQDRKIKCSRTSPCHRCTAAGVRCEFRGDGMKACTNLQGYVAALESQVESLEAFLADLKTSLPHVSIRDRAENSTHTVSSPIASQYLHGSISNVYLKSGQSLRTSYGYIPYSLSTSKILQYSNPKEHPQSHASSTTHDNDKLGQPFPRPLITECIALFFQWHYPDCMFVDRDEFLLGYLNHSHGGRHPSPGLEYAICALGALMSPEKNTRNLAEGFLSAAINSLDLLIANDASIQAPSLLLVFSSRSRELLSSVDALRYRISYVGGTGRREQWKSRLSKKMLCQLLGKPPSIPEYCFGQRCDFSESSTFPVWTNWVTQNGLSDICSSTPSVDPGAIAQKLLDLCGIINGFHFKTTQSNINELSIKMRSQSWKELMIDDINMRLLGWHDSLPINLRCSRWSSVSEVLCPNVASMHMLYHLTQISANMPFLNLHLWSNIDSSTAQPKLVTNALIICRQATEMISSIIRRFKAQYTLTTVSLPFVQGTIVAIDACLAILSLELLDQNVTQETNLRFLDSALLEMSDTWAIASYASNGLQKILREDGILRSPSTSNISLISEGLPTPEFLEYGLFSSGELAISPSNAEHQLHTHVMSNLCTWDNQLPAGNFPEPWKVDASLENYNRNLFAEDQPDLTGFELLGAANVEETDGTMYT